MEEFILPINPELIQHQTNGYQLNNPNLLEGLDKDAIENILEGLPFHNLHNFSILLIFQKLLRI